MVENKFKFDVTRFYSGDGSDESECYISAEKKQFVDVLKNTHPELSHWFDVGVASAWGAYSRDIFAVGHVNWIKDRDVAFLAYCFISQLNPDFSWGGTGLYDSDVEMVGAAAPWATPATDDLKRKFNYWKFV